MSSTFSKKHAIGWASHRNLASHTLRATHLRIGLICLLGLLPASGLLGSLDVSSQLAICVLPIALLGIMHGAVDPWVGDIVVGRHLERPDRRVFFLAYLTLMILVVVAWIFAPLFTLTAFLALSVWHFGEQDAFGFEGRSDPLSIFVYGAIPVLGPIVGHPNEVAMIFDWLVGIDRDPLAGVLRWLLQPLIAIWFVGLGMLLSRSLIERSANIGFHVFGIAVLASAMIVLPPLIAFTAYFCLLHSFGHLIGLATHRRGPWQSWSLDQWAARVWPATAGAVVLGLAGWLILTEFAPAGGAEPANLARIIFCGLAALTVPHVVLHCLHQRFDQRSPAL